MLAKRKTKIWNALYLVEIVQAVDHAQKLPVHKKVTLQFPEQRRNYSNKYRGQHYIKSVNNVENCTACMLCPTVCPAGCIHIVAGEREDKEKYPIKFEIDVLRCCFCGMCEEACPKDAIKLSNIYEMSQQKREVYDKDFLLEQRGNK